MLIRWGAKINLFWLQFILRFNSFTITLLSKEITIQKLNRMANDRLNITPNSKDRIEEILYRQRKVWTSDWWRIKERSERSVPISSCWGGCFDYGPCCVVRSEKVKLEFNPYQFNRRFMALFVVPWKPTINSGIYSNRPNVLIWLFVFSRRWINGDKTTVDRLRWTLQSRSIAWLGFGDKLKWIRIRGVSLFLYSIKKW